MGEGEREGGGAPPWRCGRGDAEGGGKQGHGRQPTPRVLDSSRFESPRSVPGGRAAPKKI